MFNSSESDFLRDAATDPKDSSLLYYAAPLYIESWNPSHERPTVYPSSPPPLLLRLPLPLPSSSSTVLQASTSNHGTLKWVSLLARYIPHSYLLSSPSTPLFLCSLPASYATSPSLPARYSFLCPPAPLLSLTTRSPYLLAPWSPSRCYVHFLSLLSHCSLLPSPPPLSRRNARLATVSFNLTYHISHFTLFHSSPFVLITGPTSLLVLISTFIDVIKANTREYEEEEEEEGEFRRSSQRAACGVGLSPYTILIREYPEFYI